MSKAYVIKNKEGKYFCGFDYFAGVNIFSERIIDGLNTQVPTLKHCREEIKDYGLKDCRPVEIIIAEGDLKKQLAEKDHRIAVLELALDYACSEIENRDNGKTNARLAIQKIINDYGLGEKKTNRKFFIDQAEKELEEESK